MTSVLGATTGQLLFGALTLVVAVIAAVRGVFSPCGLSMISAINPFTEASRGNRYWLTAAWFVLGSVLGGALFGGIAAIGAVLFSQLAGSFAGTAMVAALCCLVAFAGDTSAFGFRLPEHPRQVNERWLGTYRRWVYACGFGVQIGTGFATYIMTAAVYLAAVLAALTGSPGFAMATGLVFGLVRGLAVLLSRGAADPAALRRLHRRLDRLAPWSLRVAVAAEAAGALVLGFGAAGWFGAAAVSVPLGALAGGSRWLGRGRGRGSARQVAPTLPGHLIETGRRST